MRRAIDQLQRCDLLRLTEEAEELMDQRRHFFPERKRRCGGDCVHARQYALSGKPVGLEAPYPPDWRVTVRHACARLKAERDT